MEPRRCGGSGMVAYPSGGGDVLGEVCPGCQDCDQPEKAPLPNPEAPAGAAPHLPDGWLDVEIELTAFVLAHRDCDVRAVLRGFAELVRRNDELERAAAVSRLPPQDGKGNHDEEETDEEAETAPSTARGIQSGSTVAVVFPVQRVDSAGTLVGASEPANSLSPSPHPYAPGTAARYEHDIENLQYFIAHLEKLLAAARLPPGPAPAWQPDKEK